jgi:hypothetical protein
MSSLPHGFSVPVHIVGTDWAALAAWTTAAILLVTALFALWELRGSEQTRYAELLADLSRRWDEPLLANARRRIATLSAVDLEDLVLRMAEQRVSVQEGITYYRIQPLPNFIETLAVLEYDVSGLSIEILDQLWGSNILSDWDRWEPAIRALRVRTVDDTIYANFELLANRIRWCREGKPRETEPRRPRT